MNDVLIVDVNNILFRSLAIKKPLTFAGKSTTGIYGFVSQLFSYINNYKPCLIICCTDAPPYKRKTLYPEYKTLRATNKERDPNRIKMINESRVYIEHFLQVCNIPLWSHKGLEADDMIAIACQRLTKEFDKLVIASNDDDLYQLLEDPKVYLHTKKKGVYHKNDFVKEYGLEPIDWIRVLALQGTHNGLPGVRGIGEKTAPKIVRNRTDWIRIYQDNKEEIDEYVALIKLPLEYVELDFHMFGCNFRTLFNYLIMEYGINIEGYMEKAIQFISKGGIE